MDDAQWWATNASLLARVFDAHAYPTAARTGAAAGAAHGSAYNPRHAYTFGLQRVLDGLASLIDTHPQHIPTSPKPVRRMDCPTAAR